LTPRTPSAPSGWSPEPRSGALSPHAGRPPEPRYGAPGRGKGLYGTGNGIRLPDAPYRTGNGSGEGAGRRGGRKPPGRAPARLALTPDGFQHLATARLGAENASTARETGSGCLMRPIARETGSGYLMHPIARETARGRTPGGEAGGIPFFCLREVFAGGKTVLIRPR
jgi:hypothetical protein